MEINTFVTETDSKFVKHQMYKVYPKVYLGFTLVACLAFLVGWELFAFFEIVILITMFITLFQTSKNEQKWKLEFENDFLVVTNLVTGMEYEVYDIPASDFVFSKQTKAEKELDYCGLAIKNTVFTFGGVKNCSQLKEYIRENYD